MARISFQEVAALPDVMDVIAYEIIFGSIPGGTNSRGLTLRSKDANIPGISNEKFSVTLHGHTRHFRGRATPSGTWATTFVETVDMYTWRTLWRWHQRVVGLRSGNSEGYLADYSVTAQLNVYDTTGAKSYSGLIYELFPQEVPDVQVSGEASAAMNVPVTWSFSLIDYDEML